jgi:hypothetical protein
MREHGNATINPNSPTALGICDRCGFLYNHNQLQWQFAWRGPTLQNIKILVCRSCLDVSQEQLRTIVLPPDPVPIMNARPEDYVGADNPMSGIGASPNAFLPQYSNQIGNLTGGGGVAAAFNGSINKPAWRCANNTISNSSFNNYVGVNWSGGVTVMPVPSALTTPVITHSLLSFTAYAPNDRSFLGQVATQYVVQTSPTGGTAYAAWTTISSGTTAGTIGETISGACTGSKNQFHRIAFLGDQLNSVAIAGVSFNVAQTSDVPI